MARNLSQSQAVAVELVASTAAARAAANDAYIDSIIAARVAGAPASVIAEAAGTSYEAVRKLVEKHASGKFEPTPSGRPRHKEP
ncbi:MAG: hypothetical protein FWG25_09965 [Promicromonosporaceae bacterium]|nr:hypothetical protein [Promicromonosporaceae bacterium]